MTIDARRCLSLGVSALVMVGLATAATPAHALPGFTPLEFSDGTTTSNDLSVDEGLSINLVIDGETTGTFTGCWALFDGDENILDTGGLFAELRPGTGSATTETIEFNPGRDFTTVLGIDPVPAGSYKLEMRPGPDCLLADRLVANLNIGADPVGLETMSLTGDATLNSTVTVVANLPGSLVGEDFDLWACPDQTIRPDDNADDAANGACVGPFIHLRTGDSTTFLLGVDPVRDEGDLEYSREFWGSVCGKFFIVHDSPSGGHSNWIGPVDCSANPELAATGATPIAGIASVAAAFALLVGGGLLVATRRRHALRTH